MNNDEIIKKYDLEGDGDLAIEVNVALNTARTSERQKIKLLIKGLKEYSNDVFLPLSKEDYQKIADILRKSGYPLDRLAGNLMREAYELCKEDMMHKLAEGEIDEK